MDKFKRGTEGLVITAIGLFFLYLSLKIRNNPVSVENPFLNFFTQAKALPLLCAILLIILGLLLTAQMISGKIKTSGLSKETMGRVGILTLLTVAYLIAVSKIGFLYPTILYVGAMLFYLNFGRKKWWQLLLITAAYVAVALYLTPFILNLKLMM